MSAFSGSYNPSLETLKQQATALGISPDQVKKYGDLRHKRTWLLAIEQYQINQDQDLFAPHFPTVMVNLPTEIEPTEIDLTNPQKNTQISKDLPIDVPIKTTTKTIDLPTPNHHEFNQFHTVIEKPLKNLHNAYSLPSSFPQAVINHINALSDHQVNQINNGGDRRWLCPQCLQIESACCYLCQGSGSINQVQLSGWLLAYLELLGCSTVETSILRDGGIEPQILNLIAHTSIAIRRTGAILQRTEKWINITS